MTVSPTAAALAGAPEPKTALPAGAAVSASYEVLTALKR